MKSLYRLRGAIQHYDWGGNRYIPDLLGLSKTENRPYAELWMGAHPRGPASVLLNEKAYSLAECIQRDPEGFLGAKVAKQFNRQLPFLFKILDVRKMLSIQVHPGKREALAGFQRENEAGTPLEAPHRNFKDDNHKPEIMVALSDFWLLHGFRPVPEIRRQMEETRELRPLAGELSGGLRTLYERIMSMPQGEVNRLLAPLARRLEAALAEGSLSMAHPDYWAALAFRDFTNPEGHFDRGIFSIYFFNLVHLQTGQGIYQGAGIPHAYLRGVNVELMANSDNVFRGGLTSKHIDVPGLLQHTDFQPVHPQVLEGEPVSATERHYPAPVPDFELREIRVSSERAHRREGRSSISIFINLQGACRVNDQLALSAGGCFLAPAGAPLKITTEGEGHLFEATVPDNP